MNMQYKGFVWPNNPETCSLSCEHLTAVHKLPLGSFAVQDLGKTASVLRGEGEFFGPDANRNFCELEAVFAEKGSGVLLHPVWSGHRVFFTKLSLTQQPRRDYVAYSFEFCEDDAAQQPDAKQDGAAYYTLAAGETAWGVCRRFALSMGEFLQMNPQIVRPDLLRGGEEVRIS